MNALDFLHISGICASKSDARRCIKTNRISIDFNKLTDEKTEIPIVLEDGETLEHTSAGTWLCNMAKIKDVSVMTPELMMFRLGRQFQTLKVKGIDVICDMIMTNIFVVENGKKNFSIVTINRTETNE